MAFRRGDPCDQYEDNGELDLLRNFWTFSGQTANRPTTAVTGGIEGGGAIVFPSGMSSSLLNPDYALAGTLVMAQFFLKVDHDPTLNETLCEWNEGGGEPANGYRITLKPNGVISVFAKGGSIAYDSPNNTITPGVYQYIEFKGELIDDGAALELLVNRMLVISETNADAGGSWPGNIRFFFSRSGYTNEIHIDDFLLMDGDDIGDGFTDLQGIKVMSTLLPTADTVDTEWTGTFEDINDALPGGSDGDTSFMVATSSSQNNLVEHEPLDATATGIVGVFVLHDMKSDDGNLVQSLASSIKQPSTSSELNSGNIQDEINAAPTLYQILNEAIFATDPDLLSWTPALVNTCIFGAHGTVPNPLEILGSTLLRAWFRADLGVTEVSNAVSVWADQSGNGNDVGQTTADDRPTVAATAGPGSTPTIQFNRTNGEHLAGTGLTLTLSGDNLNTWVLARSNASGGQYFSLVQDVVPSDVHRFRIRTSTDFHSSYFSPSSVVASNPPQLTGFHLHELAWDGTTHEYFMDNVSEATVALSGTQVATTRIYLGGTSAGGSTLDGDISEVFYTNAEPSPTQKTALILYFNDRYGLAL